MEWNPIEIFKGRNEEKAFQEQSNKAFKEFDDAMEYASIESMKKPEERYMRMSEDRMFALNQALVGLKFNVSEIKENSDNELLDDIESLATEILEFSDVESMKIEFKKRAIREDGPYLINPAASSISSRMNSLYGKIHNLKSQF